jgi:hypothetical protein
MKAMKRSSDDPNECLKDAVKRMETSQIAEDTLYMAVVRIITVCEWQQKKIEELERRLDDVETYKLEQMEQ